MQIGREDSREGLLNTGDMIERSAGRIIREIFLLEIVGGGSDGEI
jgi:hypothetical protein